MEGVASEAASLAGHLKLGKLVCLYDDNSVTLSAGTDIDLHRGPRQALRGLRLADDRASTTATTSRRSTRALAAAVRRDGAAVADPRAHPPRLRLARAGQLQGARLAARRRRREEDQGNARLAGRAAVPRARRGARALPRGARARRRAPKRDWNERMRRLRARRSPISRASCSGACAASCPPAGTRTFPIFRRRRQGHGDARRRRQGDERDRAEAAGAVRAARPTSIRRRTPR